MNNKVTTAFIIPSYNELLTLPELLSALREHLTELDAVLILDDSPSEICRKIEIECHRVLYGAKTTLIINNINSKLGRGAAVRRGMNLALEEFPNLQHILECDADGSHRVEDIMKIKASHQKCDLLIGSRYLPDSSIVGWPLSRKIFSRAINHVAPHCLRIPVQDLTNGLRRYSKSAALELLNYPQKNTGFIYLSEQALILQKNSFRLFELPTTFVNRNLGKSTVTIDEIVKSLVGFLKLIILSRKF